MTEPDCDHDFPQRDGRCLGCQQPDITTTSESRLAGIPHELRFVVDKLLMMHDSGWEICGFQGGGSGKIQFQKVEWRRPRRAVD